MPQILDITIVAWFSACNMRAATRLRLLTIDYFLTRCLSRRGWDQHKACHQLTTWANGTNQLRAILDENETRAMFLSSPGSSIMANHNSVCGRTARQQKTKAATQNFCIGQDPLPREISNI